jgi:hypothetical protein
MKTSGMTQNIIYKLKINLNKYMIMILFSKVKLVGYPKKKSFRIAKD